MQAASTATPDIGSRRKRIMRPPLLVIATLFLLILFLRHPAGILHANFWAEDGWFWYPDAYRLGLRCLIIPHTGYLQTLSRLGGLIAQGMPLLWAPTVFAVIALVVQASPALLLLSRRFDAAWPQYWSRLLFALVFIGLPDSFETFGNLTNSQWYLGIFACLIVLGAPPRGMAGRIGDSLVLIVSALSGPLCLMVAPIAFWVWWSDRGADRLLRFGLILGGACLQLLMIATTLEQARRPVMLGVSLINLAHILTEKLAYGLLLGSRAAKRLHQDAFWNGDFAACIIAAAVLAMLVLAWLRGGPLFRRFAAFGGLVFAAALVSPVVTGTPAWVILASPGAGDRYFLIPKLVLAAAFFSLASDRRLWLSRCGLIAGVALIAGIAGDFPYPHMRATDFDAKARAFAAAPPGTMMTFPVLPIPHEDMTLVKK
ncbi:hypothetical protein [Acidisoma silvae]|uniref:Glucosyltransferase n=1 Tax=Acidisoma silvae TaxID=2802396 RepID=A0A964E0A1_9PROT|nr:hypothetical protein [Acidisoma silvae]MCB8877305.1 hypothetical protein [Acidisoma silvae]